MLAGAVTGIGFIGGGLVLHEALGKQQVVRGLTTAAAIFAATAIGAAAGQGRLLIAGVATALCLFVLEIRHIKVLSFLDGRRWSTHFSNDFAPEEPSGKSPQDQAGETQR